MHVNVRSPARYVYTTTPTHSTSTTQNISKSFTTHQPTTSSRSSETIFQKNWFSLVSKPKAQNAKISSLYLILKLDGRARLIGSYFHHVYKPDLAIASKSLNGILKSAPLKHFILFNSTTLKQKIAHFNKKANQHNLNISNKNFDVKNFYTEIVIPSLIQKVRLTFAKYKNFFHTSYIGIPKHDNKLPVLPHFTNNPKYFCVLPQKPRTCHYFCNQ